MSKVLHLLTIEEAAAGLKAGDFSSLELVEAHLAHVQKYEEKINSFVKIEPEIARTQAAASDERRKNGKSLGLLDGIPYTLKDVFATKGSVTTASSRMLEDWQAPYDSTVYKKLWEAGAVLLGKTNTDEFTMGSSTETSYFGVSKNPWDLERVSGGSSGGPAAAMAARFGTFSIGTDTGGSIRQPAAFCGVVGLRPTYGRISRFGELPMASSLDQTGPITQTMRDAAIVFEALAGEDPLDATSAPEPVKPFLSEIKTGEKPLAGMKIGIAKEYFGEGVDPECEAKVREAIGVLVEQGAEIVELSLPNISYSLAAYYIIAPAEISSNMARYDGIHFGHSVEKSNPDSITSLYDVYAKSRAEGLGAEVKRRIILGSHVLSSGYHDEYYNKAEKVRAVVAGEFAAAFERVDILAAPVSPAVAFKIGEKVSDPLAMYKEDVLTVPLNIGGIPGVSLPCGFVKNMPVGLQLMAGRFKEEILFQAGAAYQSVTDYHLQLPELIRNSESE
ncbi:MAG: aspartyl/glutamyl-tRNA amidotransferase subunit [Patescibacteria group bacterium]|jgi:aspartyl-tRNA(Asn)/glutamyl-tRNA(Gln) amidotransferase subunit A|nr:aspartyl/glutamyl-tRNA amidotransferase subunit [Patescibacteria group bacterium]